MNDAKAKEVANKIFQNIFNQDNIFNLDQLTEKFAFDVKLPKRVMDSTTNEEAWANSVTSGRFITQENMKKRDNTISWLLPKQRISNMQDLINIWKTINLTTTDRIIDSINVSKSDAIYSCENVYRSADCRDCKLVPGNRWIWKVTLVLSSQLV